MYLLLTFDYIKLAHAKHKRSQFLPKISIGDGHLKQKSLIEMWKMSYYSIRLLYIKLLPQISMTWYKNDTKW